MRLIRAAFPGPRAIWIGAGLVTLLVVVICARILLAREAPLLGTNSVGVGTVIARTSPNELTCIRDLAIPAGTNRLELFLSRPRGITPIRGELSTPGRAPTKLVPARVRAGSDFVKLRLPQTLDVDLAPASLCLRSSRGLGYGGANVVRLPDRPSTTVGGATLKEFGFDLTVRYLGAESPRTVEKLGDAFARMALFKPFGPLVPALAFLTLLAAVYGVVRVMALATRRSVRGLAARAAALALAGGVSFAILLPIFGGPDEAEHFAYAVHVAAAGERADAGRGGTAPFSSQQSVLMAGLHSNSVILNPSSRPRWDERYEEETRAARTTESDDDGGGYTESASGHSPLYYRVVSLPYEAFSSISGDAVMAMRLWNALLACGIAALAVWCASLLAPRSPRVWWLAGVLVGAQPVFASVSGSVNNDTLVNLLGALAITLTVHAVVRGPRAWAMVALGVAVALLPLAKGTGFALWPVVAIGLAFAAWRHRSVVALIVPAVTAAICAAWVLAGGVLLNTHPVEAATAVGGPTLPQRFSYLVETIAPFVTLTGDYWDHDWPLRVVYVERGYNLFGWPTAEMTEWVMVLVKIALLTGWLFALRAAWRGRARWRERGAAVLVLVLGILAVLSFVAYAYATLTPRVTPGEQGRYIFPAIVPLAVLFALGANSLRNARHRELYLGAGAAGASGLMIIAWLSVIKGLWV